MYEPINKNKNNPAQKIYIVFIAYTWSHRENGEKYMIMKKETDINIFWNTACYCLITVMIA